MSITATISGGLVQLTGNPVRIQCPDTLCSYYRVISKLQQKPPKVTEIKKSCL